MSLPQEKIEKLKERREQEITASLVKLNNDIFKSEKGLSENDRVYLVAASIMATLGDVDNKVYPLTKAELKSSDEEGDRDGDIMIRKINSFLNTKKLPKDKKDLIVRTLQNTLTTDNINKPTDGESQLKRVFIKIVDDLGIYYKIGLTTDFTGKLFNEMLIDAKNTIKSPKKLALNSSNILNKDSLNFDGHYGFGKTNEKFPVNAFVLNPPYSAEGNGMIFVEKALSMM